MFFSQCLAITVRFKEFVSVSPLKKMRAPYHTGEGWGGANDDKELWLTWLSVSFLFFCFLFWLYWEWWWPRVSGMIDGGGAGGVLGGWLGGESLQVESRWVCTVRAPPLTTFVKSITRTTPEQSNDAGRLPLKRLYSFWTQQINYYPQYATSNKIPMPFAKKIKKIRGSLTQQAALSPESIF